MFLGSGGEDTADLLLARVSAGAVSTLLAQLLGTGSRAQWLAGLFDIWLVVPPQQTRLCPEQDRRRPQPAAVNGAL